MKLIKTGLFFGSFNPVHNGHIALASYIAENTNLNELWFVISPQNPLKKEKSLLSDHLRLKMLELALKEYPQFSICSIEFQLPKPSFTINTLTLLTEKHPGREFILIMGADGLPFFNQWKEYQQIISNYRRIVYPRPGFEKIDIEQHTNTQFLENAPLLEISSSHIRNKIANGESFIHLVPEPVYDYIKKINLYKEKLNS